MVKLWDEGWCRSGQHYWGRPADAQRCCNGWERQVRLGSLEPGDDPALAVPVKGTHEPAWFVWQEVRA